jgi:hypothetical protein
MLHCIPHIALRTTADLQDSKTLKPKWLRVLKPRKSAESLVAIPHIPQKLTPEANESEKVVN